MMTDEWGPWIDHDGRGCPCVGEMAQWELDGGHEYVGLTDVNGYTMVLPGILQGIARNGPCWMKSLIYYNVIRYRIRKPKGLTILEGLLENLPERETA